LHTYINIYFTLTTIIVLFNRYFGVRIFHLFNNIFTLSWFQLLLSHSEGSELAEEDKEVDDEAAENTADATDLQLKYYYLVFNNYFMFYITCIIVGSITSMLRELAMCSGNVATESNQKTGNITSGKFLNRYSIPSTFLSKTFS
jgi:hypothetical protein